MKKTVIFVVCAILLATTAMQAQNKQTSKPATTQKAAAAPEEKQGRFYFGGGVGLNLGIDAFKGKDNDGVGFGFRLAPEAGFQVSDKIQVGAVMLLDFNTYKLGDGKNNAFAWGLAPYVRFDVLRLGKLALQMQGTFNLGGEISKAKYGASASQVTGNFFNVGINLTPRLAYRFNKSISLYSDLNFVSVGINFRADMEAHSSQTYIGFAADTDNFLNTNAFSIGFLWHLGKKNKI